MVPVQNCTGCTACVQICPTKSIEMKADPEGFLYPCLVDELSCINCGLCENTCPLTDDALVQIPEKAFGCHLKDTDELLRSTSGGAFYAIGRRIIENHGVVYGAVLRDDLSVCHQRAEKFHQLESLRKSKYVQSDLSDTFSVVKRDLQQGLLVLFSGTPCQVAGLNAYLGRAYDNLLTVQVFCAEVLSPTVWNHYMLDWKEKNNKNVVYFEYRTKLNASKWSGDRYDPWRNPQILIRTSIGEEIIVNRTKDPFINAWANHLISRPSCTDCQFKFKELSKYPADLSIGDFWGCENNAPECFCALGTSAVIAHTPKGEQFFNGLTDLLDVSEVDVSSILKANPNICTSVVPHPERIHFFDALRESEDFEALVRNHLGYDEKISSLSRKIGLIGSYNTRTALADICANSSCQLMFQYSNSSLISMTADAVKNGDTIPSPSNPFRAQMLEADFDKRFVDLLASGDEVSTPDCLVIDFLEERFQVCSYGDSLITLSDAAVDTGYPFVACDLEEEETIDQWKKSCLKLIELLRANKNVKSIILVKAFLNEEYGTDSARIAFSDLEWIRKINRRLSEYYNFFQENMPTAHVISLEDDSVQFCDKNHKHGCYPWHANQKYYRNLSPNISKYLLKMFF